MNLSSRLLRRAEAAGDPFNAGARRGQVESLAGHTSGLSLVVCAGGLALSALVELATGGDEYPVFVGWAAAVALVGALVRRSCVPPARVRAGAALDAVLASFTAMIAASTGIYLLLGTFDSSNDALFESVSGFSTTALSVLPDPEAQGRGVLFWRALTQWIGGFSALVVVVAVLPFLGVGGPQPSDARPPQGASHLLSPHVQRLIRQYLALYVGLSAAGIALFLAGGMSRFDAVTYSLTTVSTGGFANHSRSFAHFDSALIEWFGIGGMLVAGMSLALLWRAIRGKTTSLVQSTELRVYLALFLVASVVVALWTAPSSGPTHTSVREAIFSVASALSTTGHTVTDWGAWPSGPQVVLLVLIGIGAMSGSVGGGFRVVRGVALVSYIWRELLRQLRPRTVRVVRVGHVAIDETLVARMIGYQVLYIVVLGVGTFGLALFGDDILSSVSGAISALGTMGPALGEFAPEGGPLDVSVGAQLVLVVVMLSGRLEIYPVLNAVESALTWPLAAAQRFVRRTRLSVRR